MSLSLLPWEILFLTGLAGPQYYAEPSRRFGDWFCRKRLRNEGNEPLNARFKEFSIEILFSSAERQINFYFIAFFEKFICLPRFEREVVLWSADADADAFDFNFFSVLCRLPGFFFLLVDVFPAVSDFCDRRIRGRRDFNEVKPYFKSAAQRLFQGDNTKIGAIIVNDSQFSRAYLVVYFWFVNGV